MNNLNQCLLEGTVCSDLEPYGDVVLFKIVSRRYFKNQDGSDFTKVDSIFTIETRGELAENCQKNLTEGRGVRIIGRMAEIGDVIGVVADHVIFKPTDRDYPKT